MELFDKKEVMEAYNLIYGDPRGDFREVDQRCDSTDTRGDEFLMSTGERNAFQI